MKKVVLICGLAGQSCWVDRLNNLGNNIYLAELLPKIFQDVTSFLEGLHQYDLLIIHSMSSYLLLYDQVVQSEVVLFDPNIELELNSPIFKIYSNNSISYRKKLLANILVNSPCICGNCGKTDIRKDVETYLQLAEKISEMKFPEKILNKIQNNNIPLLASNDWAANALDARIYKEDDIDHLAMITNPKKFENALEKIGLL